MEVVPGNDSLRPKLNVFSVFKRTFSTPFQAPLVFLVLTTIANLPAIFAAVTVLAGTFFIPAGLFEAVAIILQMALKVLGLVAICHAACQVLNGDHASVGHSLGETLPRFFPFIGALIPIILVFVFFVTRRPPALVIFLLGVIVLCILICAVPACMREHLGPVASLKRSAELTKGNRWRIFLVGLLFLLCLLVVTGLLFTLDMNDMLKIGDTRSTLVIAAFACIFGFFFWPIFGSVMAVIYHDLSVIPAKAGMTEHP